MRILIHGINFAPELTGIGKYSGEMAAWLARRGHDVRVVTAPPYYPDWRVAPGYAAWRYRRQRWPAGSEKRRRETGSVRNGVRDIYAETGSETFMPYGFVE